VRGDLLEGLESTDGYVGIQAHGRRSSCFWRLALPAGAGPLAVALGELAMAI